jgi:hypothetical protein
MKDTIASKAKANGINPQTARNRIQKGWTVAEATTRPTRGYSKTVEKKASKADAVWAYLVANPLARPVEVSKATGVTYGYVYKLMSKVGTPREVFEAEAAAKADVTEDVSLEQFVADDTSPFPPRAVLIKAAVIAIVVAWLASSLWL